ncbi:MAG TPA: BatA domain-containing protein [Phycisphaerae bacterium]|nr:BatA domain-containing protein [Phycisphaerae bacterium]
MTFANRAILVGLVALAIPLAIHLLGRRRAPKVVLPTARFAEGAHASSRGWLWLKRAGLLALRMALVALVVLALAGPRFGEADTAAARWVLVFDTSPSMAATGAGGTTAFARAHAALAEVVAALPPGVPVALVLSGDRQAAGTAADAQRALAGLTQMALEEEPLGHMVARATAPAAGRPPPSDIHVVLATDATPWALRDLGPGAFGGLEADVTVLAVGGAGENIWLGLPQVDVADADQGRSLGVSVEVRGNAGQPVGVFLELAGRPTKHTQMVPAGGGTARFAVPVEGDGPWQGQVSVMAADALEADNVRYFTAAARQPIRVLVVDAADEPGVRLRSADLVAAAFAGDADVPKQVTRLSAAEADPGALAAADVVFWVGAHRPGQWAAAQQFVRNRGAFVWVPADAGAPADKGLAAWLQVPVDAGAAESPEGVTMDPAGYASDLLAAFEGGTSGDLGAAILRQRLPLGATQGTAVRFHDGWPAIQSRREGKGRVVVLAFGPSPSWGDLASRAEWVVLVHSLAEVLAPRGPQVANLTTGQAATRAVSGRAPGNYTGKTPGSEEIHYSVNAEAQETADLVPQVDRLKTAFADDRLRVVTGDFDPETVVSAWRRGWGVDLVPLLVVALAAVLAGESVAAAALSGRGRRRFQS